MRWIVGIAAIYAGLLLIVYLFQDALLFFPRPISLQQAAALQLRNDIDPLELRMSDGTIVRGWLVKSASSAPLKLLFYYGGNAEELSHRVHESEKFGDYSLVLVNFRGYGNSDGKPGEAVLQQDALEIFDQLVQRFDVDPKTVVLMGRSLGTGIAVKIAAQRPLAGVILVSPYDSMVRIAHRHYPFLPTGLLLRHRFESFRLVPAISTPTLILAAAEDSVVPKSHSQLLAQRWGGQMSYCEIDNADHNTIDLSPRYWAEIRKFLDQVSR